MSGPLSTTKETKKKKNQLANPELRDSIAGVEEDLGLKETDPLAVILPLPPFIRLYSFLVNQEMIPNGEPEVDATV